MKFLIVACIVIAVVILLPILLFCVLIIISIFSKQDTKSNDSSQENEDPYKYLYMSADYEKENHYEEKRAYKCDGKSVIYGEEYDRYNEITRGEVMSDMTEEVDDRQSVSSCYDRISNLHAGNKKFCVSKVELSAVVPKRFTKGEYSMVDISVYEEEYRNIVDRIIKNADTEVKEVVGGTKEIGDNTSIRIVLSSPDIDIVDCDETQVWCGKYLTFSFPVEVPKTYSKRQILFVATVYFNNLIASKLKFVAKCSSWREQKIELEREDILSAFMSYASQDRARVATIIQGMIKARPDMNIFFDVDSLRSGENWENALQREIEKRDILFLCWSEYAKVSKWVEKEWKYALSNKGLDAIEPVPLISPDICPPPEELKSKHFNDRALLYANT